MTPFETFLQEKGIHKASYNHYLIPLVTQFGENIKEERFTIAELVEEYEQQKKNYEGTTNDFGNVRDFERLYNSLKGKKKYKLPERLTTKDLDNEIEDRSDEIHLIIKQREKATNILRKIKLRFVKINTEEYVIKRVTSDKVLTNEAKARVNVLKYEIKKLITMYEKELKV